MDPEIDVAVYFQPHHDAPPEDTLDLLDVWLSDVSTGRRSLVYVVRDYDARIDLVRGVLEWAEGELATLASERLRDLESDEYRLRCSVPFFSTPWFFYEKALQPTRCEAIWTSSPWNQQVRAELADLVYSGRIEALDEGARTGALSALVECPAGPVVAEKLLGDPQDHPEGRNRVIVVSNGSFLVNYALINKEHRALALALSRELGAGRRVAFIEDPPSRRVHAREEGEGEAPDVPTGLSLLAVWPLNGVLVQLLLVGVLYALYRFPILGRPRSPRQEVPGFSLHVEALGSLLEDTGDRALAREIVRRCRAQLSTVAAPHVGRGRPRQVKSSGAKQERS
jgi:hypothetical protein